MTRFFSPSFPGKLVSRNEKSKVSIVDKQLDEGKWNKNRAKQQRFAYDGKWVMKLVEMDAS